MSQKSGSSAFQKPDVSYVGATATPQNSRPSSVASNNPHPQSRPSSVASNNLHPQSRPSSVASNNPQSRPSSVVSNHQNSPKPERSSSRIERDRERGDRESARHHMQYPGPGIDSEWEAREEMRLRELEEARARASQMEKTMRWWSDCTANWREKWSKVRNERNKAREENRQLRSKLEATVKELTHLKRQKQELLGDNEHFKKQLLLLQQSEKEKSSVASGSTASKDSQPERDVETSESLDHKPSSQKQDGESVDFLDKLLSKKLNIKDNMETTSVSSQTSNKTDRSKRNVEPELPTPEEELVEQKIQMVELKLDEAQKTIQAERDEKTTMVKTISKLQAELTSMKNKYDEVKKSKHEIMQELNKLREEHQDQLSRVQEDLEDESCSRSNMDKRLADLRMELERLQAENAAEWGKRERLETEKLGLERDNKKLRIQIKDIEEEMDKKNKQTSNMMDSDLKAMQHDLYEKNKELHDLKHAHSKLKKLLQDKTVDLDHAKRRAEQYELEVKKLRGRVEELKKDLASAEDEVDTQANQVRKLQRTNDELQEQMENQQVQIEHLQTRLKNSSNPLLFKSRKTSLLDPNESGDDFESDAVED